MQPALPTVVRGPIVWRVRLKAWTAAAIKRLWDGLAADGYVFAAEGGREPFDYAVYAQLAVSGTRPELHPIPQRTWHLMCAVDDVKEDEGLRVATEPAVAIFQQGAEFFCIDDACTHGAFSLSEGYVDGCVVECPMHLGQFSLRTGKAVASPAFLPVKVHPVVLVDGDVYAALPDAYRGPASD